MFLAACLLLFISEHPNNTAHGYTQPSQPLPVFTSSASVSGDAARVPTLNKRKQNPPSGHGSQALSQSFQGIRLSLSRCCGHLQASASVPFIEGNEEVSPSKPRFQACVFLWKVTLALKTNYSFGFSSEVKWPAQTS